MCYIIDSANTEFIKEMLEHYDVLGITTNPTIISKESKPYKELLQELDHLLQGRDLHIQLTEESYEGMIQEAKKLKQLITTNLHIKIPVSKNGFKAIKTLSNEGYSVTATAICNVNQGIMAALAGAEYLAVYVNRLSNSGIDGNQVIKEIKTLLKQNNLSTKIVGASYKSIYQVTTSLLNGADQVTVGPDLFDKLFHSEVTDASVTQFTKDFKTYNKEGELS